jgi:hypothetical protein
MIFDTALLNLYMVATVSVFSAVLYLLSRIKRKTTPTSNRNGTTGQLIAPTSEYAGEVPDDWGGDEELRLCTECNGFNHREYIFCQFCTAELRTAKVVPNAHVEIVHERLHQPRNN